MSSLTQTGRAPALALRLRSAPRSLAFGIAGAVALAVYFVLPGHVQPVAYVVVSLAAVVALYAGILRGMPRAERLPWNLIGLGLLGQVADDVVYAVYEVHLHREPPSPSVGDLFDLVTYPLFAVGVFLMLRRLGGQTSRAAILDSLVVFAAVMLAQWVFFIHPHHHSVVRMIYPGLDVLLLVALGQFLLAPARRSVVYALVLASVVLWTLGDEFYALRAGTYTSGSWIDAFWLSSNLAWGAAALDPSVTKVIRPDRRQAPRVSTWRLLVLSSALCIGPAIAMWDRHTRDDGDGLAPVGILPRRGHPHRREERQEQDERQQ